MVIRRNPEYDAAPYEMMAMLDGNPNIVNRNLGEVNHHRFAIPPPDDVWKDAKRLREWARENSINPFIRNAI